MLLSSPHKDCSYRERQPTPNNGTPAVIEEVVEVREAQEAGAAAAAPEGRPRPRKVVIIPDLMPRPRERLEEIETWIDAS